MALYTIIIVIKISNNNNNNNSIINNKNNLKESQIILHIQLEILQMVNVKNVIII